VEEDDDEDDDEELESDGEDADVDNEAGVLKAAADITTGVVGGSGVG
jgi:hypothetical protein